MKRTKFYFQQMILITIVVTVMFSSSVYPDNRARYNDAAGNAAIPNMVVIKFKSSVNTSVDLSGPMDERVKKLKTDQQIVNFKQLILNEKKYKKIGDIRGLSRIFYAEYMGNRSPYQVAEELSKNPIIEYAEPKYMNYIETEPNDPLFDQQRLYYQVIEAPGAWDIIKGGEGSTIVAIVDGGTDINHQDLQSNIWINPIEYGGSVGVDDDGNGFTDDIYGWNFANNSGDPTGLTATPFNADHGTHTAGIASAVSDNGIGLSGVSWNATIMAINVSDAGSDRSIAYGFDGILYAAANGADIISCSWGRLGGYSQSEQDIVNAASSLGILIVAAAGNDNSNLAHFPSSYDNVLSVAGTTTDDRKWSGSNYGTYVDLAAPAVNIYSTYPDDSYGGATGTSMATPLVAGAAALVQTKNPGWNGIQAGEQVRVTADSIDDYSGQLGKGRLNVLRAVSESSPSVRLLSYNFVDQNSSGVIEPGEQVDIYCTIKNYLATVTNLSMTLFTSDPYVDLISPQISVPQIGILEQIALDIPFIVKISNDAPAGHNVEFEVHYQATGYDDRDYLELTVLPLFADLVKNSINVTISNLGRIGHPLPEESIQTLGFSYSGGPDLLFEGAIICGTAATQISNAARVSSTEYDRDFVATSAGNIVIDSPGYLSDQESFAQFNDHNADNPMNLVITQSTYAWSDSANEDYVIFLYVIRNTTAMDYTNFHFGLFFDWDLDATSYITNVASYESSRNLGFVYDIGDGPDTYCGVSALSDQPVSYRAIYNNGALPKNPAWGLYDGFSDSEKWESISGGIVYKKAGPEDVSFVIANGPISIPAFSQQRLAFAMIAGDDSVELFKHADSARAMWNRLIVSDVEKNIPVDVPATFYLGQNYPNPFNPVTTINYQLPVAGDIELSVFNLSGQQIAVLVKGRREAGTHSVSWDASGFASGVYYCQLRTHSGFVQTRKLILLK